MSVVFLFFSAHHDPMPFLWAKGNSVDGLLGETVGGKGERLLLSDDLYLAIFAGV